MASTIYRINSTVVINPLALFYLYLPSFLGVLLFPALVLSLLGISSISSPCFPVLPGARGKLDFNKRHNLYLTDFQVMMHKIVLWLCNRAKCPEMTLFIGSLFHHLVNSPQADFILLCIYYMPIQ